MTDRSGSNPTIALLTDFSWHNWYLGVMRGVILKINPDARIVDLCHDVSSQDIKEGSFILDRSFRYFPPGTIFLCVVDPGVGGGRSNLIVKTEDYFFVAPDNGILTPVFEDEHIMNVYDATLGEYTLELHGSTFYGRDVFAPLAAHLSLGVEPSDMGVELDKVLQIPLVKPHVASSGEISGRAVYVDDFGNIITNISEDYINRVFQGRVPGEKFMIRVAGRRIHGLKEYYEQAKKGKLIALIDSWGYVELAVNRGNAYEELDMKEKKSLEIFLSVPGMKGEDKG